MSTAAQIADLITRGVSAPTGPEDVGFHTGTILAWDESSQTNTVLLNNVVLTNLKAIQNGIGVLYGAGDSVFIIRKQSQYFVVGKVSAPGSALPNQIRYGEVSTFESTGSTTYTDLATVGPTISNVLIGSSRRFLLMVNVAINLSGTVPTNTFVGGIMSVDITGASTISTVGTVSAQWLGNGVTVGTGGLAYVTRNFVMTSGNGVNPGLHTFKAKYLSLAATPSVGFRDRNITVIPF